jgi:Domain of unknown function (DUF1871)
MDALKELNCVFDKVDPLSLKTGCPNEYSCEANDVLKELPYINTSEKLTVVLQHVFEKSFSKKLVAKVNWKALTSAVLNNPVLGRMINKKPKVKE